MKKRTLLVSAILGTLLLATPLQSQAFFCGFGGGFSFGGGGWGYPYYGGYHPRYGGYGGYPYYAGYHRGYLGYGGYPHYAYRPYSLYSYPLIASQPMAPAPELAEK